MEQWYGLTQEEVLKRLLHPFGPGSRKSAGKGTLWPDPGHDLYTGFR